MKNQSQGSRSSFNIFCLFVSDQAGKLYKYLLKKVFRAGENIIATPYVQTLGAPLLDIVEDLRNIYLSRNRFSSILHASITVVGLGLGVAFIYIFPSYSLFLQDLSAKLALGSGYLKYPALYLLSTYFVAAPISYLTKHAMRGIRWIVDGDPDFILTEKDAVKLTLVYWQKYYLTQKQYQNLDKVKQRKFLEIVLHGVLEAHELLVKEWRKRPIKRLDQGGVKAYIELLVSGNLSGYPINYMYNDEMKNVDSKQEENLEKLPFLNEKDMEKIFLNLGLKRMGVDNDTFGKLIFQCFKTVASTIDNKVINKESSKKIKKKNSKNISKKRIINPKEKKGRVLRISKDKQIILKSLSPKKRGKKKKVRYEVPSESEMVKDLWHTPSVNYSDLDQTKYPKTVRKINQYLKVHPYYGADGKIPRSFQSALLESFHEEVFETKNKTTINDIDKEVVITIDEINSKKENKGIYYYSDMKREKSILSSKKKPDKFKEKENESLKDIKMKIINK